MNQTQLFAWLILLSMSSTVANLLTENGVRSNGTQQRVEDFTVYRLPAGISPSHYNLSIDQRISEGDFRYTGGLRITISVTQIRNSIILHSDMLVVEQNRTRVTSLASGTNLTIVSQSYDTDRQFFLITFSQNLELGLYEIELAFSGEIRDDLFGFYRSHYDVDGERRWIGLTQFSPTFARRAFPCFDEPHLKATFNISIRHNLNQTCTSNTERIAIEIDSNLYVTSVFTTTPRMSTYLVGWVLHDFPRQQTNDAIMTVRARPAVSPWSSYALRQGQLIYRALQNWMNVTNPIEKVDQFAIPDFNFNAMENWGLVTYRESIILFQDRVSTTKDRQRGLTVMSHEYAHKWFGNLVTPYFWDVVWLKEGFASYFQHYAVSLVESNWRLMESFVVDVQQPVMVLDSYEDTTTMNREGVGSPETVRATLDSVSYRKAASVIRMLSHIIGPTAFREGLQSYLRNMSQLAATPTNLYEHLQIASDASRVLQPHVYIDQIMNSWTNQPGYPLVTITRNYTTRILIVSQERFYINRKSPTAQPDGFRWWIPLNFATELRPGNFNATNSGAWLRAQDDSIVVNGFDPNAWVIYNVQQSGYYRVNYDETNWNMLINYLKYRNHRVIPPVNRASLLDDAFNLARAGYIDYSIPLNLTSYLIYENDYIPWVAATNGFKHLDEMLSNHSIYPKFQSYVGSLSLHLCSSLSFHEGFFDDHVTKLHRNLMLSLCSKMKVEFCVQTERRLFNAWIAHPINTIVPDLKSFVYCSGIREGNEADWNTAWERYLTTELETEKTLILTSLGCTQDPAVIKRYLNLSITPDSDIRQPFKSVVFNSVVAGNLANAEHALDFIEENLQRIIELRGLSVLSDMLVVIGRRMTTAGQVAKLKAFVQANTYALSSAINGGYKAIRISEENVAWISEYSPSIGNWLDELPPIMMSGSINLTADIIIIFISLLGPLKTLMF